MNLSLFFASASPPELAEIVFSPAADDVRVARRGKGLVFRDDQGSFQWTKAVKAFALLVVGTQVARLSDTPFELQGEHGSPAASLDFAISKPTEWISGLFGGKGDARDLRRLVFKIVNSEQKLPGPVSLRLCASLHEPEGLAIYINERKLSNPKELLDLFCALGGEPFPTKQPGASELERVLSMRTAPSERDAHTPPAWYARPEFERLVYAEISKALRETEVMEQLGIDQAKSRLAGFRTPDEYAVLEKTFTQLSSALPPEYQRYNLTPPTPPGRKTPALKVGCPPMAMSSLLLLRSVSANYNVPIDVFSHHQSSSSILSTMEEAELDYAILSWGAAEKMIRQHPNKSVKAVMLLPRTSIDLLCPDDNSHLDERPLPVYVSKDPAGYPYQLFEILQGSGEAPWCFASSVQANIVEIIARLTSSRSCGIVSFPFSGVLALHFGYRAQDTGGFLPSRLGDNILFRIGSKKSALDYEAQFASAIRSEWYAFLESEELLRQRVRDLLSDTQYIQSLKRLGGLYRISGS